MISAIAQSCPALPVLSWFQDLPTEIRCKIWSLAAPSRPRVIQIAYSREKEKWHSCPDSCGGLPTIISVCHEARQEALRPYTKMLETWVDLNQDTIFISDTFFTVREARSMMMNLEYTGLIKRIAFTEEVYFGMKQVHQAFPKLVDPPAAVLRKMRRLTHFSLALMDDGKEFSFDAEDFAALLSDDEDPDDRSAEDEEEDGPHSYNNTEGIEEEESESIPSPNADDLPIDREIGGLAEQERRLGLQEANKMKRMSNGYFRHVGDIHFESATHSPDYWDSWYPCLEQIQVDFDEQQVKGEAWSRPLIAVVETKPGLNFIGRASDIDWRATFDWTHCESAESDVSEVEAEDSVIDN
ncbi:hypothetical protein QTJ16_003461 [Diplocarpon rosae]|uniref:2EXR domain-containing protein n=1 Tax=Diplocarpon rosae TaxID=946125 RepID=A0AAD9WDM8_9HELO|nr:hypothetical protein QTJ16_003461 [Diplocarpon rosae]PBP21643.1 hypothetical protein BUE80_DR007446 [Diplocarpon rosae]